MIEKANQCNSAWKNEPEIENNPTSPHFKIATEIIVAVETIEKAFDLFKKNDQSINDFKNEYYFLYWKQLSPDIRGWVMERTKSIAVNFNDVYKNQIELIHKTFKASFELK